MVWWLGHSWQITKFSAAQKYWANENFLRTKIFGHKLSIKKSFGQKKCLINESLGQFFFNQTAEATNTLGTSAKATNVQAENCPEGITDPVGIGFSASE